MSTFRTSILDITREMYFSGRKFTGVSADATSTRDVYKLIDEKAIKDYVDLMAGGGPGGSGVLYGEVTWRGTGYIFDGSATGYVFNGGNYTAPYLEMTLSPADPSFSRIDVFFTDIFGSWGVLEGVPSATPVKPQVDPATQMERSFVVVEAASTTPLGITNVVVYDENTESTFASDIPGINAASAVTPFNGSVNIAVPGFATNKYFSLLYPSTLYASNYQYLLFKQKLGATFTNSTFLSVSFFNGATQVAAPLNITSGTFGFNRTIVGSFQFIVVPLSAFQFTQNEFDKILWRTNGSNATGFQIDLVTLQAGNTIPGGTGVNSFDGRTGHVVPLAGDYGPTKGGTGQTAVAVGDLLIGTAANVWSRLPAGTNGHVLTLVAGVPVWSAPSGGSMVYPGAGIPVSTGSGWGTSITDNSSNWNTAFGWGNHSSAGYLTGISGTANRISTAGSVIDISATYVGQTSITTLGTIATGTWSATAIAADKGGTGQTVYTVGALLYADTTTTLAKLAAGTNTHVLTLVAGLPTWSAASGGGGTPGGATTQVQFNNAGAFGGDSAFAWNNTTKYLNVGVVGSPGVFGVLNIKSQGTGVVGFTAPDLAIWQKTPVDTLGFGFRIDQGTGDSVFSGYNAGVAYEVFRTTRQTGLMAIGGTPSSYKLRIYAGDFAIDMDRFIELRSNQPGWSRLGYSTTTEETSLGNRSDGGTDRYVSLGGKVLAGAFSPAITVHTPTLSVGIGIRKPVASAILEIVSTTKGFLPPRMTATQAAAIASPAEGLLLYITVAGGVFLVKGWWGWNGAAWEKLNN